MSPVESVVQAGPNLRSPHGNPMMIRTRVALFVFALSLCSAVTYPAHAKTRSRSGKNPSPAVTQTGTPPCRRANLSLKEGETDAAMGGVRLTDYIITNKSTAACTLKGYPRVELLNQQKRIARRAVDREQLIDDSEKTPPQVVTLEPGKTAWFRLHYNSGGAGLEKPCPSFRLQILAPGTTGPFVFRSFTWCPGTDFEVSPVRAGKPPSDAAN
jgi:hypothetical protein